MGTESSRKLLNHMLYKCHLFPQEQDHLYFAIKEQKVLFPIKALQSGNMQGGEGVPGSFTQHSGTQWHLHLVGLALCHFLVKLWRTNCNSKKRGKPLLKKFVNSSA